MLYCHQPLVQIDEIKFGTDAREFNPKRFVGNPGLKKDVSVERSGVFVCFFVCFLGATSVASVFLVVVACKSDERHRECDYFQHPTQPPIHSPTP